ncbi:MAG: hypothetical protein KDD58_05945 [Bdellovibrionales bacterium]|nr:hypothetical protein [Bdellovibrionales bacterium]
MHLRWWLSFFFIFLLASSYAMASGEVTPTFFNVEGALTDNSDNPVTSNNVDFIIGIYGPYGTCLLYEEEILDVDLSSTNGVFNLAIGQITAVKTGNDPGLTYVQVFQNINNITGLGCGTFMPSSNSDKHRIIKIQVSVDGNPYDNFADIPLGSIPYSLVAESLQGLLPTDFIKTDATNITQAHIEQLTDGSDITSLHHHDTHNDARYIKKGDSSSQNLGTGTAYLTGASAKIGIGTSTPAGQFEINTNNPIMRITDNDPSAGDSQIEFMSGASNAAQITVTHEKHFQLSTNSSLAIEIDDFQKALFSNSIATGEDQPLIFRSTSTNSVSLKASNSLSQNYVLTWPNTAPAANEVLKSDALGNLSWTTMSGSANATQLQSTNISSSPPTEGQVLKYNNSSSYWEPSSINSSEITSSAVGNIVATNIQAAIAELDSEKFSKDGGTITGATTITTGDFDVSSGNISASGTISTTGSIGAGGILIGGGGVQSDDFIRTGEDAPLEFRSSNAGHKVSIMASNSLSTNYTLTLPTSGPAAGQYLESDAAGNLNWVTPVAGGGTIDGNGVTASTPSSGDTLEFNGANWVNTPRNNFPSGLTVKNGNNLQLNASGDGNSVMLRAPATLGSNLTFVLPNSSGANGQVLTTNGASQWSWTDLSSIYVDKTSAQTINGNKTFTGITNINNQINISKATVGTDLLNVSTTGSVGSDMVEFNSNNATVSGNLLKIQGNGDSGTMVVNRLTSGTVLELKGNSSSLVKITNILGSPRVGIGTNSPATTLDVDANTDRTIANFESADANPEIVLAKTGNTGVSISTNASNDLVLGDHTNTNNLSLKAINSINVESDMIMQGTLDMNSNPIVNVPDTPANLTAAVNQKYVDDRTKVIALRYFITSGQTFNEATAGGSSPTSTRINFNQNEFNIGGGAVTTGGSWTYTVPGGGDGIYQVSANISTSNLGNASLILHYGSGGASQTTLGGHWDNDEISATYQGTTTVKLNAGDIIYINFKNYSAGSISLDIGTEIKSSWITINRLGGYIP